MNRRTPKTLAEETEQTMNHAPRARGLYDPRYEHDACGIGAVVNISGRREHAIVEYGKQVLLNLMHRGAAGADESTGDGAGILLQIPHEFFAAEAEPLGFALPEPAEYGVAMVFLPAEATRPRRGASRSSSEAIARGRARRCSAGATCRPTTPAWATSPGRPSRSFGSCSSAARGFADEDLERRLFVVRKRVEHRVREQFGEAADEFYVCSMSCRTIVYKGMFLAPQLFAYYPDLADERVRTALAIVHQRYSTNTFPSWRLAQPFRMIAHNGEINTLRGNANRLQGREKTMALPGAGRRPVGPVSRSSSRAGATRPASTTRWSCWSAPAARRPHALMMMIPEAFGPRYHISTDKRAFYEYHAAIMEPWDGPAAMVFTDGRLVGGTLDRNGLRPCRYVVTTDGLVVLASEVGVIEFPPEQIRQKGPPSAGPDVPGRHARKAGSSSTTRSRARSPGRSRTAAGWRRTGSSCAGCSSRRTPAPDRSRDARPAAAVLRLHPRRAADDPRPRWRPTARSRSARWAPTRRWRCSPTGRSCCSTTSSSCSPR